MWAVRGYMGEVKDEAIGRKKQCLYHNGTSLCGKFSTGEDDRLSGAMLLFNILNHYRDED